MAVASVVAQAGESFSRPRAIAVEGLSENAFRIARDHASVLVLVDGALVDETSHTANAILRDARVTLTLPSEMFLFRDLDFPSKALDFLDGVLRAQMDRLTPWSSAQAVYGHSAPVSVGLDRIKLTLAAAPLAPIEQIVRAFGAAGAHSVVIAARREDGETAAPILVHEGAFQRERTMREARRGLKHAFVGVLAFAGLLAAASGLLGAWLETRAESVAAETRQWRDAQMAGARDPDIMLHKHKFETPLAVLVIDQLARILPDDTYLREMQLGEGKVELAGVSADATRLVAMLERSAAFSRATFSAPTTHTPNEPGDQFRIQAQVNARYGQAP
ncbi:MAG: PilN domain-containing protein [Rhodoblastus sp.]|nr:PilN domain-containing protein [Rhodoblastus sp.]